MNLGRAIKTIRENNFLSKEHLAELLGVTSVTIRNLEISKTRPTNTFINNFCKTLGVTDSYLLFLAIDSGHAPDTSGIYFDQVRDRMLILLNKGNWIARSKTVSKKVLKGKIITFTYKGKRYDGMVLSVFKDHCIINVGIKELFKVDKMNKIKQLNT